MDRQQGNSTARQIRFIPAEKGWLALVRKEQLDADFIAEIKRASSHSREDILCQARKNHAERLQGHATWRRQHRTEKSQKAPFAPRRFF